MFRSHKKCQKKKKKKKKKKKIKSKLNFPLKCKPFLPSCLIDIVIFDRLYL